MNELRSLLLLNFLSNLRLNEIIIITNFLIEC